MDFELIRIPQPFFKPTNSVRIGDAILDTGHMSDASTKVLREQLESGKLKGIREIIITHPHVDHIGGSEALAEAAEKPHTVFKGGDKIIRNFVGYLLEVRKEQLELFSRLFSLGSKDVPSKFLDSFLDSYFPINQHYRDVNIWRVVEEGEEIRIGKVTLTVIHTPGHEANHMALYHKPSGTLFSGDLIADNAQFAYAPLTSSVRDYENSLRKVLRLKPRLIVPSHGGPIENPTEHLNKCLENVQRTKGRILNTLMERGEITHFQLVESLFNAADPMRVGFLAAVVLSYLDYLEEEGKVMVRRNHETMVSLR